MENNEPMDVSVRGMWLQYLEHIGTAEGKMSEVQEDQMRKTFYAAVGALHIMLRDVVGQLPPDAAMAIMHGHMDEVAMLLNGVIEPEPPQEKSGKIILLNENPGKIIH